VEPVAVSDWEADANPTAIRVEYRCKDCNYGLVASDPPPICPMCQATIWDPVRPEPVADLDELAMRRLRRSRPEGSR
jgi:Zn finger protein HypA/HybF involved in hydrogenase expression